MCNRGEKSEKKKWKSIKIDLASARHDGGTRNSLSASLIVPGSDLYKAWEKQSVHTELGLPAAAATTNPPKEAVII